MFRRFAFTMLALGVAVCCALTMTALPADASGRAVGQANTRSQQKHTKPKKKKHHKPKPLPKNCPGLGKVDTELAWFDHYGNHPAFISKLICTAANNANIQIKMYFIEDDPGAAATVLRDITIMHKYHHVQFELLVDRWHSSKATLANLRKAEKATPGAHWYSCSFGCESSDSNAITHSKYITVSKLRTTHRPALFTTSTNITHEQLSVQIESGVLFSRNPGLYGRFVKQFNFDRGCATHGCPTKLQARNWQNFGGTAVYFAPTSIDPISNDLDALVRDHACSHGGMVDVDSLWLTEAHLIRTLQRVQKSGCTIHVVLEHPERDPYSAKLFHARVMRQHDKYLVVSTPTVHRVYTGTQDFGTKALRVNDNFMIRSSHPSLVKAFIKEFAYQWEHSAAYGTKKAKQITQSRAAQLDLSR